MQRVLFLIFSLFLVFPLRAETVGEVRALETARTFFRNDRNVARRMASLQRLSLSSAPLTKRADAAPAYHVFNRTGGGFVIIAGDDACTPILAYSYTNNFGSGSDMPAGLRRWLDQFEEQVEQVRSENKERTEWSRSAWESLFVGTKSGNGRFQPAVKLDTPPWGQGEPFNRLAPVVNGERAVAGCVPLSMAMIMRFFTWPLRGEGKLETYTYSTHSGTSMTIPGFDLGYPYEWEKIRYDYRKEVAYTEAEADAVARLVYDCGVAVQASFDNTTSAHSRKMAVMAVDHFGFDPSATKYNRDFYTDAEWTDLLKQELQSRPILYSAYREGPFGHAFLLDGYDNDDKFSINWGWDGASNGYYALSAFSPSVTRQYLFDHAAVLGLRPAEGGAEKTYLYLSGGTSTSGTVYKGIYTDETIETGKPFKLVVGFLYNGGNRPFTGSYVIALLDADNRIKEFVSPEREIDVLEPGKGRGWSSVNCTMTCYPVKGDHLSLMYRSSGGAADAWSLPLCSNAEGMSNSLPVEDTRTLAEVTGVNYSKMTQELVIRTKDHVEWQLTAPSGTPVTDGIVYDFNRIVCKTANLPKGAYLLTLKRGEDIVILTLKMGNK